MKYLAFENQDTRKESTEIEFITERYMISNCLQFISEECYEEDEDRDFDEDVLSFNDVSLTEGSHVYIEESDGRKYHFIVKSYETSKAEDIVKELKDFSINAKKRILLILFTLS